jgi:hypothetical protein
MRLDPVLAELIGQTVLLSRVSDHATVEVPQALIDDTPAFAAYLAWRHQEGSDQ